MTFKEFRGEYLTEMAIAQRGNLKNFTNFLTIYNKSAVKDFLELIDKNIKIKKLTKYNFELYRIKNRKIHQPDFVLGYWTKEYNDTKIGIEEKDVFRVIFAIQVSKRTLGISKYKNVINIDTVFTEEDIEFQRKGIATAMYLYLVNNLNYNVLGDIEQYFGARKLWTGLSKIKYFQVDLLDLKKNTIRQENIILTHGDLDNEFDKRIWDLEENDSYIGNNYRLILTKIKQ